jgi:hypothetical protein
MAVALLLLSYPENRNAYEPFTRLETSETLMGGQVLVGHGVGSRVDAADIWTQLPVQESAAV